MDRPNANTTPQNTANGRQQALELISWMQAWEKYNNSETRNRTEESEEAANTKRSKRQRD